ncbi:MAG: hypothetical protein C4547_14695 [Phycisphaerales bacterium]|nr:MAG: hypothetical protein C4547_14695 [Phycisphaerales bacterium]
MNAAPPRSGRARRLAAATLLLYGLHAADYWPQINDDAFITFRYSRFLAAGRGPYFNEGEHVEGFTNFLMMPLIAAVIAIAGPSAALPAAKIIGVASGAAALLASRSLCRRWLWRLNPRAQLRAPPCAVSDPRASARADLPATPRPRAVQGEVHVGECDAEFLSWAAAALVAVQTGFMLNTTTGLETALFSAWITIGLALAAGDGARARPLLTGGAFALAALTRPEGVAVFGLVVACRLVGTLRPRTQSSGLAILEYADARSRPGGRDLLIEAGVVAVAVAGMLAVRLWCYDGQWLPNTYFAKAEGMVGRTGGGYLWDMAARHFGFVLWAPAFLAPWLAPALRRELLAAVAVAVFAIVSVCLTGPDWMPGYRLVAPYTPVWAALMAFSMVLLLRRRRRALYGFVVLLPVVFAAAQLPVWMKYRDEARVRAAGYERGHAALAAWLNEQITPRAAGDRAEAAADGAGGGAAAPRAGRPEGPAPGTRAASPSVRPTVALMDIGIIGFLCPRLRILDITGLTDRTIARSPGPFLDKRFDPSYVFDQRPEYLVITMHARLNPDGSDDVSALAPWTPIEARLVATEAFAEHYFHPRPPAAGVPTDLSAARAGDDAVLAEYAAVLGAERVFRHTYPGYTYLLAVYVYSDGGGG